MANRLRPPLWVHDAYPLRELAKNILPLVGRVFLKCQNENIVDFGCGDSPYQPIFEEYSLRYINCDLTGSGAEIEFEPNKTVPIPALSAVGVVSFQVLEHVSDPQWYLREAHRMLKDDGVLVLSTHGTWPYHPHPQDYRRWTRTGLVFDIEAQGFDVVEMYSIVGPVAWTLLFQCMAINVLLKKIPLAGVFLAGLFSFVSNLLVILADKITPFAVKNDNASIYLVVARKKV